MNTGIPIQIKQNFSSISVTSRTAPAKINAYSPLEEIDMLPAMIMFRSILKILGKFIDFEPSLHQYRQGLIQLVALHYLGLPEPS